MSTPSGFDLNRYGPIISELLTPERLPELGPGRPSLAVRDRLAGLNAETVLGRPAVDLEMARACIGALWLYHDFLDESHRISQTIENSTGSYWHGLMHRREPDSDNAKYWFRRVGDHFVFPELARQARELAAVVGSEGLDRSSWLISLEQWKPLDFIDTCRDCLGRAGADQELCRRITLAEWQVLFDFSYHRATGR